MDVLLCAISARADIFRMRSMSFSIVGMYASQVWGTEYVKEGQEFSVLKERGHVPLQFYWFKSVVKMYNCLLKKRKKEKSTPAKRPRALRK
eukprot:675343-Pelagomonas_calceolata.AAC.1